jgi:hypothetical protein
MLQGSASALPTVDTLGIGLGEKLDSSPYSPAANTTNPGRSPR